MRHGLGEPHSYPFRLNDMLRARYRLQSFTVINSGRPAEVASAALSSITNLIGELRLSGELLTSQAEVLLLMEGTNDLFVCVGNCPGDGIPMVVAALDDMVRDGQQRGARVLLATIPPQRRGGRRDAVARVIPQLNDEIRALAARRNAVLVDVFAALEPGLQTLIGVDDLHPTIEGHRVIAETFFSAIQKAFEAPAASTALRRVP
jgi:lysophospholipase L1-like esterase